MKRCIFICGLALTVLLGAMCVPVFKPERLQSTEVYAEGTLSVGKHLPIAFGSDGFSVNAGSAVLMDADSGSILFAQNADQRRGMASTTKIMTALVILETLSPDKVVEITPDMTGVEGSSLYLKAGEKLTVEQLLYGLMLESGNDAAVALAIVCDGSIEAFAERMNMRAKDMGLVDTQFANPHGLSAEGHYTTARELAKITAEAMKIPLFQEIVSTYKKQIPYDNQEGARYLTNHNPLLTKYEGILGVKTGWTTADGKCFVTTAEREGLTLIAVTLGDTGISATHTAILNHGFETFEKVTAALETEVTVPLVGGVESFLAVKPEGTVEICLPKGETVTASVETAPFVYAGTKLGTAVGRVVFTWNGLEVGSVLLVTAEEVSVRRLSFWEKLFG